MKVLDPEPSRRGARSAMRPPARRAPSVQHTAALSAGVALAGTSSLVALGEMVPAVVLAAALAGVGLVVALIHQDEQIRATGVALVAASLTIVAVVTAPIAEPVLRLGIVAAVVAPFVLGGSAKSNVSWWSRPPRLAVAITPTIVLGLFLGVLGSVTDSALVDLDGTVGWALVGAAAVAASAAAVEEILFRGVILDGLGSGGAAVVGTAVLGGFSAAGSHSTGVVVLAVLGGIAWGSLRRITGSLWMPVLGHVTTVVTLLVMGSNG